MGVRRVGYRKREERENEKSGRKRGKKRET